MTFAHTGSLLSLFAQQNQFGGGGEGAGGAGILAGLVAYIVFILLISILTIAGMWKTFTKAGQPGWAAIVPIYNLYVLTLLVAKKEMLWFVLLIVTAFFCGPLFLIPLFVINSEVAAKFGRSTGFGVGLTLLAFIFYPILGFGSAQYQGIKKRPRDYDDEDEEEDEEEDERPRGRR